MSTLKAASALRRRSIGFFGLGAMGGTMFSKVVFGTLQGALSTSLPVGKDDLPEKVVNRQLYHDLWTKTLKASWDEENQLPVFWAWDKYKSALDKFEEEVDVNFMETKKEDWFKVANEPADIARNCSIILTMLPSSPHVAELYLGPNGIVPTLKSLGREVAEQTLCIDHTSLDHNVAIEVAKRVRETGARMIDAPVSGGVVAATEQRLSFMVGGDAESVQRAEGILKLMGKRIVHCGDSGAGMAAKICNNLLLGISMVGTAEAMLLGSKLGLKPDVLASVINSSTGRCWASEINNPVPGALPPTVDPTNPNAPPRFSSPADKKYVPGFKSSLMAKDLGLAVNAGSKEGLFLPLGSQARGLYDVMVGRNWGDYDFGIVYKFLESAKKKKSTEIAKEGQGSSSIDATTAKVESKVEEEKKKKVEEKIQKSWEFDASTPHMDKEMKKWDEEMEKSQGDEEGASPKEFAFFLKSLSAEDRKGFEDSFIEDMYENLFETMREAWKDSSKRNMPEFVSPKDLTDDVLNGAFIEFTKEVGLREEYIKLVEEKRYEMFGEGKAMDEQFTESFLVVLQDRLEARHGDADSLPRLVPVEEEDAQLDIPPHMTSKSTKSRQGSSLKEEEEEEDIEMDKEEEQSQQAFVQELVKHYRRGTLEDFLKDELNSPDEETRQNTKEVMAKVAELERLDRTLSEDRESMENKKQEGERVDRVEETKRKMEEIIEKRAREQSQIESEKFNHLKGDFETMKNIYMSMKTQETSADQNTATRSTSSDSHLREEVWTHPKN